MNHERLPQVYVVDDDVPVREALSSLFGQRASALKPSLRQPSL
jgi:FixJ family two-component response regulator